MKHFVKTIGLAIIGTLFIGLIAVLLWLRTPAGPRVEAQNIRAIAASYDTRIIRDQWGVPHIFGTTDADTSFGLGYAHAEDDWPTIQSVIIASRGMGAQYKGKSDAPTDYLYDLFKVKDFVAEKFYTDLKPETQAIAKAYADAINLYGVENPDTVLPGVLPVSKYDVAAGFTWALPFFYRMDEALQALFAADEKPKVSPWQQEASLSLPEAVRGSNAFAIAPSRSEDGHTRLIANTHQPLTGPYAWYEAHVVSKEGLNLSGATFPGTPILTQGVTPRHGWTHTVNKPDLVDIYALEVDREKKPRQYKLDGEWRDFERSKARFRVRLFGAFSLPVTRDILWSVHGPVLSTPTGHYAIQFAGLGHLKSLEQWYEMSKAESLEDWKATLSRMNLLSFNIVYADKDGHIASLYNARSPRRIEGPNWREILPGDRSELIWTDLVNFDELPQLYDPDSGWIFSANNTPFKITDTGHNNRRDDFSETMGIEPRMTNRALQALALFEPDKQISEEELLRYRSDTQYHPNSLLMTFIKDIVTRDFDDPLLKDAQAILREWDGNTLQSSRGAALAVITGTRALGYEYTEPETDGEGALLKTAQELKATFGRLDPEWGRVNRLQRGDVDLPLDGSPDVMRAIYADRDGLSKTGVLNAFAGDTHIMYADWDADGNLTLKTIHPYGSATLDATSPHYNDQSPLFARGDYKTMPMTLEAVEAVAKRDYRPGQSSGQSSGETGF